MRWWTPRYLRAEGPPAEPCDSLIVVFRNDGSIVHVCEKATRYDHWPENEYKTFRYCKGPEVQIHIEITEKEKP